MTHERRLSRTTKGAFAAAAAAPLLLGGGGTLAYWTASSSVEVGTITSGTLELTEDSCEANWVHESDGTGALLLVPGDKVTKSCTFTVAATGDHLTAEVDAPNTVTISGTNPASASATVAATYMLGATPLTDGDAITSSDNGKTLEATFTVTFPFGDATTINANDTQNWTAALDNLTVTLTQTQTLANPAS